MANIIANTFTTQNTPYFLSHDPYQGQPIDLLQQMISYNITPNITRTVNYEIGAQNNFQFEFRIKNMTLNETLEVEAITDVMFGNQRIKVTLAPGQTENFLISLAKEEAYGIPRGKPLRSVVSFVVKNTQNANIVFRDSDLIEIERETLPTTFNIS